MDFATLDDLEAPRQRAVAWVQDNVDPGWADEQYRTGTHSTPELHARLARDGILGAGWPKEYGGSDVDPDFARAVYRQISEAGLQMHAWMTTYMVVGTIREVGTEEQRREYIPARWGASSSWPWATASPTRAPTWLRPRRPPYATATSG